MQAGVGCWPSHMCIKPPGKKRILEETQGCQRGKGGSKTTSPPENDQSEGQEAKGTDSSWPTVKCHQEVKVSLKNPHCIC